LGAGQIKRFRRSAVVHGQDRDESRLSTLASIVQRSSVRLPIVPLPGLGCGVCLTVGGLPVTADVYPYTVSSTGLTTIIPDRSTRAGRPARQRRFARRSRLRAVQQRSTATSSVQAVQRRTTANSNVTASRFLLVHMFDMARGWHTEGLDDPPPVEPGTARRLRVARRLAFVASISVVANLVAFTPVRGHPSGTI
jgi:hypothetical protein